ncbi:hypothetical protein F2Q68_00019978 [Brassica cretica]|uniref:Uncharacterized protein n=1 Tax=Brassica cretica TaxID=69181 RepID=A0A8S9FMD3_BRACR|nr:hypothetical protein F2Q68_00019978 [Brassica cretica]
MDPSLGPDQVRRSVSLWAGLKNGRSNLDLNRTVRPDYGGSGYGCIVIVWSCLGLILGLADCSMIVLIEELRLIVVKLRSREESTSERLCGVWVDRVRNGLIIAYRTHCNLCIESHLVY